MCMYMYMYVYMYICICIYDYITPQNSSKIPSALVPGIKNDYSLRNS